MTLPLRIVVLSAALAVSACATDKIDTSLDLGYLAPGLYCPEDARIDITHVRLVGFGTADAAVLKPSASYPSPGRLVERWTTAIIGGGFTVLLVPTDGADEVHVAARAVCGSASSQSGDAQGRAVRVTLHGGILTVQAVSEIP